MLGEISSETVLQGLASQAPSIMSNRPGQQSPPVEEELAKPMDSLQVMTLIQGNTCLGSVGYTSPVNKIVDCSPSFFTGFYSAFALTQNTLGALRGKPQVIP